MPKNGIFEEQCRFPCRAIAIAAAVRPHPAQQVLRVKNSRRAHAGRGHRGHYGAKVLAPRAPRPRPATIS